MFSVKVSKRCHHVSVQRYKYYPPHGIDDVNLRAYTNVSVGLNTCFGMCLAVYASKNERLHTN